MKKVWRKPKLVVLYRGRPEEVLIAGNCKLAGHTTGAAAVAIGCRGFAGGKKCGAKCDQLGGAT